MSKERALAHLAKWGRDKDAVFTGRDRRAGWMFAWRGKNNAWHQEKIVQRS